MSSYARFLGVVLTLGGAALLADPPDPATIEAINKQADEVAKKDWKELTRQGEALAKKHDLAKVMQLLKPRSAPQNPGIGVGKKPGDIKPDGIEAKIISMKRNPMPPDQLQKEQADLIRLAEISAAVASVSNHQSTVDKKMGEKDPAKWKEWMEEMHKESQNLIKAVKAKKPEEVRDTAKRLHNTCLECHSKIRDAD
jgi:hypothetical protein